MPRTRRPRPARLSRLGVATAMAAVLPAGAVPAQAQPLIRPTSAVAGSEFSSLYDIGNVIDGSGLPLDFGLSSIHASYAGNNHWTTENGALAAGKAHATFFFKDAVALTHFHMWNHLSDGIAVNGGYGVTSFNLHLRDGDGANLFSLLNQSAIASVGNGAVQTFRFNPVENVKQVRFEILSNVRGTAGSPNYTGLAEVAFSYQPQVVPEPSSIALMAAGLFGLVGVQRHRRKGSA